MSKNAPTTIEKFVSAHLARIAVEPYVPPHMRQADTRYASAGVPAARSSRSTTLRVLGRAALVFICGMAVGYLISDQPDASSLGVKGTNPGYGASGLRIDYDLRDR